MNIRLADNKHKVKASLDDRTFFAINYVILGILTVLLLYPLIYIVSSSFSSGQAVSAGRVILWPVDFSLLGYKRVFDNHDIWLGYRNTLFYTVAGTAVNIAMTLLCAYPLARRGLPHKSGIMFMFTFTMLFSGGMIPGYLLLSVLGILNTVWAMIIPGAMGVYQMIVTRTFIATTIPEEMMEAAQIDGCDDYKFFALFVLPLSKAIIAVMGLQYAVMHWNSYFNAMLYLSSKNLYPLQLFLRDILILSQIEMSDMMDLETALQLQGMADLLKFALIVVATVPIMCVYPFLQKYFVKGVMIGSIKG